MIQFISLVDDNESLSSLESGQTGQSSCGRGRRQSNRGRGQSSRGREQSSRGHGLSSRGRGQSSRRRGRGRSSRGRGQSSRGRGNREQNENAWKWENSPSPSTKIKFTGNLPGPEGIAHGVIDHLACFHLFLPEDYFDSIMEQTNLYASQQRTAKQDIRPWKPVTMVELMAYVGLNIAMGIVSLPALRDYWTKDPVVGHPWFRSVMSRNRFMQIHRYFHLVDNTKAPARSSPNYDKLWKIRPMLEILHENCQELYSPHQQLSVDKSMIRTKCRLSFIQYMKAKPVKWGIKVWICCDSVNGYICSFSIYTGKDTDGPRPPHGLGYQVVMNLTKKFVNKGYIVYTDNFYSSPQLSMDLLSKGLLTTGTLRSNRKNVPQGVQTKERSERGDCKFYYHKDLTVVKWRDNRDVFALSTYLSNEHTSVKRRVGPDLLDVPCPEIIADYNQFMGGVDMVDQYMCYYSIGRKSTKWWRKVVWRLLDQAIANARVIYVRNTSTSFDKQLTNLQFRLMLVRKLTEPLIGSTMGPAPSPQLARLTGKHFPYLSSHSRRRCAVCAYKKTTPRGKTRRGTKTKTWCPKCEVHICMGKCFELYHTRTYYRNY